MPAATLSIDLDDLWAYRRSFGLPDLAADGTSLLPLALPRFAAFMQRHGVRGTAFVVGRDAAAHAPLLRQLASVGHELANHSHTHATDIERWPAADQAADLRRAHDAIAAVGGNAPRGFRAPSFRLSPSLLGVVQSLGYRYDASSFPSSLGALARRWQAQRARGLGRQAQMADDAFGTRAAWRQPLHPHTWALAGGALVEVPVTTLPGLRLPLHGTYLQHLADHSPAAARAYATCALALCRHTSTDVHFLLHGTDFIGADDALDTGFLPGMRRPWRAKVALLDVVVERLRAHFELTTMGDYVDGLRGDLRCVNLPSALAA